MAFHSVILFFLGLAVSLFGTLMGAGGGFILLPILYFLYPEASANTLTSVSLAIVFLNAASGSVAYAIQKKIDYRAGILFALAALPGSIAGSFFTGYFSRRAFAGLFGTSLILASIYFLLKPEPKGRSVDTCSESSQTHKRMGLGIFLSFFVGFISSLLGIGGGIIHVPILVHLLGFRVHAATATSHFILAICAAVGVITHIAMGSFNSDFTPVIFVMAFSVIFGAQIGAKLSTRINGRVIVRLLAGALALVGIRLFF